MNETTALLPAFWVARGDWRVHDPLSVRSPWLPPCSAERDCAPVTPIAAVQGAKKYQAAAPCTSQDLLGLSEVDTGARHRGEEEETRPGLCARGQQCLRSPNPTVLLSALQPKSSPPWLHGFRAQVHGNPKAWNFITFTHYWTRLTELLT